VHRNTYTYRNWTAPGLPEPISFELCGHGWRVQHGVSSFGLYWRSVSDGFQKKAVIEPIDPVDLANLGQSALTLELRACIGKRKSLPREEVRQAFRMN